MNPSAVDSGGFRHDAIMYAGPADFLNATLGFINDSIDRSEPILVVVDEEKIDALKYELGAAARAVDFADMTEIGVNPGRIISAWYDYLNEHADSGSAASANRSTPPARARNWPNVSCTSHYSTSHFQLTSIYG